MREVNLSGWGRTAWSSATVLTSASPEESRRFILGADERGLIPRGLGRAYGAAAQNAGGRVLEFADREGRVAMDLDESTGILRASAATSIEDVLLFSVPRGWFVPVTPGTRQITLGGAVASDVHGKNHHVDGTFGAHVERLGVLLSDGSSIELDPRTNHDWFWATVGGMGLTGVITDVTLRMRPIETPLMTVTTNRVASIDAMFEAMGNADASDPYSVAWIDLMATGRSLGRGVLTTGRHSSCVECADLRSTPEYAPRNLVAAPPRVPGALLNRATIRCFNELWYRRAPKSPTVTIESIPKFFHPLDGVRNWNRLYGRPGFVQYQFIVPLGREDAMSTIVEDFARSGVGSFLAVLKRMGPENPGFLSFPTEGWTLALDLPARSGDLPRLLHRVDEKVIAAGGRHYLAKDCHLMPWAVRAGYPQLERWRSIRAEMDPLDRWISDLARRLDLVGGAGSIDGPRVSEGAQ